MYNGLVSTMQLNRKVWLLVQQQWCQAHTPAGGRNIDQLSSSVCSDLLLPLRHPLPSLQQFSCHLSCFAGRCAGCAGRKQRLALRHILYYVILKRDGRGRNVVPLRQH